MLVDDLFFEVSRPGSLRPVYVQLQALGCVPVFLLAYLGVLGTLHADLAVVLDQRETDIGIAARCHAVLPVP